MAAEPTLLAIRCRRHTRHCPHRRTDGSRSIWWWNGADARRDQRELLDFDSWRRGLSWIGLSTAAVQTEELRALFVAQLAAHHAWVEAGQP